MSIVSAVYKTRFDAFLIHNIYTYTRRSRRRVHRGQIITIIPITETQPRYNNTFIIVALSFSVSYVLLLPRRAKRSLHGRINYTAGYDGYHPGRMAAGGRKDERRRGRRVRSGIRDEKRGRTPASPDAYTSRIIDIYLLSYSKRSLARALSVLMFEPRSID